MGGGKPVRKRIERVVGEAAETAKRSSGSEMHPRRAKKTLSGAGALSTRTLSALLAVAEKQGLEGAVLNLASSWDRGRRVLQRLRRLSEQVGRAGGWRYLAELLEATEVLASRRSAWSQPEEVLMAPLPPLEHLLAAVSCRLEEAGVAERGMFGEVKRRLERRLVEKSSVAAPELELAALSRRIERLEAQLGELLGKESWERSGEREGGAG